MGENRGKPKRLEVLIIHDDPEAPSLLNPLTGRMFITNRVGKRIIELADGTLDVAMIASRLAREFHGAREEDVRAHAEHFLAEGERKEIVIWTE